MTEQIFAKFDDKNFKSKLDGLSEKLGEITVSNFKPNLCVDCGAHLSRASKKGRCRSCNMRIVGQERQKQLRMRKIGG